MTVSIILSLYRKHASFNFNVIMPSLYIITFLAAITSIPLLQRHAPSIKLPPLKQVLQGQDRSIFRSDHPEHEPLRLIKAWVTLRSIASL